MSAIGRAASIDDLRTLAKRRLPRFAFDFIDGGAETEHNLEANRQALQRLELVPRYLIDVSDVQFETELFETTYAMPLGIAPVGFLNMAWPDADLMMARLAARNRIPHAISTASSTALEAVAEAADGFAWFQIYVSSDDTLTDQLLRRAKAADIDVLVVTIDVPTPGKRDRDTRNGLQIPFRLTPGIAADLMRHPRWSFATLRHGAPGFGNFTQEYAAELGSQSLVDLQKRIISCSFTWQDLARLRDKWNGRLLLKGVLHEDDAKLALEAGCDGIVVSNHGGRQADYAPASISALAKIAETVGGRVPLLLDSGVRRGSDMVRAKALGADFVLAGRAFAYGAAAGREPGCARALEILRSELTSALGQIGCPRFVDVGRHVLAKPEDCGPR